MEKVDKENEVEIKYLIETIKKYLTKIHSINLRLFVVQTQDNIKPCGYCTAFKKSPDYLNLIGLGDFIGLSENYFKCDIIEVDWVDKFFSDAPYQRRLTKAGRMWYACRASHIYHFPTIEIDLVLKGDKGEEKILIDNRWNSIGIKDAENNVLITIFLDVINFIKERLVNSNLSEMIKQDSRAARRYIVGNDPLKKKTQW